MKLFKRSQDLGINGEKAKYYDTMAREFRMDEMRRQATEVAEHLKEGDSVLEIASGAGYLSIELSKLGKFHITGTDISNDLIEIAKDNAKSAAVKVEFQQGNVSALPFAADSFNFIVCVLAFKNFKEPIVALKEMYRVLKPGGTVLIMDLNGKASLASTKNVAEAHT